MRLSDELRAVAQLIDGHQRRAPSDKYRSIYHFVLAHGFEMNTVIGPGRLMKKRECFRNAAMLVQIRDGLIYCEGFARLDDLPLPIYHAWAVDQFYQVIDPTWGKQAASYFGVPIKTRYLREFLFKFGRYGLIDCPENKWPLLRANPKRWKHEPSKPSK